MCARPWRRRDSQRPSTAGCFAGGGADGASAPSPTSLGCGGPPGRSASGDVVSGARHRAGRVSALAAERSGRWLEGMALPPPVPPVELAPRPAQNSLGKRFLRDVELRLRCHHHARSVPRRRWSRGLFPFPVRGWAHPASGQVSFFAAFIAAWRPVAGRRPEPLGLPAGRRTTTTGCPGSGFRRGRA